MNKLKKYFGIILAIYLGLQVYPALAGGQTEKTVVEKKYDVVENASLIISHQFGQVNCKNWAEPSISVEVVVRLDGMDADLMQEIIDRIDVDIEGDETEVSVSCDFNEKILKKGDYDISIDVNVMMPENIELNLDHQFGNAYIDRVSGASDISVEYGSLEIKALMNESNDVEIGFGEAQINYLHGGDVEISYSSVSIDEGNTLSIESSYSDVTLGKVKVLEIENEGGQVDLGEVEEIDLASKFAAYDIGKVAQILIIDAEYGSVNVGEISSDFSKVLVENSFGSVGLTFQSDASFSLEANMEFCDLGYPSAQVKFSERISQPNEKYYKGVVGSKAGNARVEIESSFGNVSIDL